MALTIDALKGLYEKLGGEDFGDVITIPEAIDKVAEVAESGGGGGGSDLPDPGAVGNVLTSVPTSTGTAWESTEPKNALHCVFQVDETVTCDKSIAMIREAVAGGRIVYGTIYGMTEYILYPESAGDTVRFTYRALDGNNEDVVEFNGTVVDGADVWTFVQDGVLRGLPAVSATNNGQILGVDNGAYALVSPASLSLTPLVIEGTVSGSTFTQTSSVTAEQIRDAIAAHRPIYIDMIGGRFYYNAGGYGSAEAFTFSFSMQVYDADDGEMNVTMIVFDNTMATGTVQSLAFTPTT